MALKEGNITVYDINGNLLASEKVITSEGYVDIKLNNISTTGILYFNVTYNENDKYLSSHSINDTTGTSYLTVNIAKMNTITNIEAKPSSNVNNVTLTINVTNTTGDSLSSGRVEIRDAITGELLGEGTLNGEGKVNITLNKEFVAGDIRINVTFMGDDYYGFTIRSHVFNNCE